MAHAEVVTEPNVLNTGVLFWVKEYNEDPSVGLHEFSHTISENNPDEMTESVTENKPNTFFERKKYYINLNLPRCICRICEGVFDRKHIKSHLIKSHSNKSKKECKDCKIKFTLQRCFLDHMTVVHSNINNVKCLICGKILASYRSVKAHIIGHHRHKIIPVTEINTENNTQDRIGVNEADIASKSKNYISLNLPKCTCKICGKVFDRIDIIRHLIKFHANKSKKECTHCKVNFPVESSLRDHMVYVHSNRHNVKCVICGKILASYRSVKAHTRLHRNKKTMSGIRNSAHLIEGDKSKGIASGRFLSNIIAGNQKKSCKITTCEIPLEIIGSNEETSSQHPEDENEAEIIFEPNVAERIKAYNKDASVGIHKFRENICKSDGDVNISNCRNNKMPDKTKKVTLDTDIKMESSSACETLMETITKNEESSRRNTEHENNAELFIEPNVQSADEAEQSPQNTEHKNEAEMFFVPNFQNTDVEEGIKDYYEDVSVGLHKFRENICKSDGDVNICTCNGSKIADKMIESVTKDRTFKSKKYYVNLNLTLCTCNICEKEFNRADITTHLLNAHANKRKRYCTHCKVNFTVNRYFLAHMTYVHSNKNRVKCVICGKILSNYGSVKTHVKSHHMSNKVGLASKIKIESSSASETQMETITNNEESSNQNIEHENDAEMFLEPNVQSTCDIKDCNKDSVCGHFDELTEDKLNNIFENKKYYVNLNLPRCTCKICGNMFDREEVASHLLELHADWNNKYCKHCKINFKTDDILQNHMTNVHSNKNNVKCVFCDKIFSSHRTIGDHIINHRSKEFMQERNIESSAQKTEGENEADIIFSFKNYYVNLNLPKCICKICGIAFDRIAITNHLINLHTDKIKKECNDCKIKFTFDRYLQDHMTTVHSNRNNVRCLICSKILSSFRTVKTHLMRHQRSKKIGPVLVKSNQTEKRPACETLLETITNNVEDSPQNAENEAEMPIEPTVQSIGMAESSLQNREQENELEKDVNTNNEFKSEQDEINEGVTEDKLNTILKRKKYYISLKLPRCTCKICGEMLDREDITSHLLDLHADKSKNECTHCKVNFKTGDSLRAHMTTLHSNRHTVKCIFCDKIFSSHRTIGYHIMTHRSEFTREANIESLQNTEDEAGTLFSIRNCYVYLPKCTCKICGKVFDRMNITGHLIKSHANKSKNKCRDCNINFEVDNSLRAHMTAVHSNKGNVKCVKCGKILSCYKKVKKHVISRHAWKEIMPAEKEIKTESSLKAALHNNCYVVRINLPEWNCNICGIVFHKSKIRSHLIKVHSDKERLKCNKCCTTFNSYTHLRCHMIRVHSERYKMKCLSCGKCFSNCIAAGNHKKNCKRSTLETTYDEENKPLSFLKFQQDNNTTKFKCLLCQQMYPKLHDLKQHMINIHNQVSVCSNCGSTCQAESCPNKCNQEKKLWYKCETCNKLFNSHHSLVDHTLNHKIDNAFQCEICGRAFTKRADARKHVKDCHNNNHGLFLCNICSEVHSTYESLVQHVIHFHGYPINCYKCNKQVNTTMAEEYKTSQCGCKHICEGCFMENCPPIFMKADIKKEECEVLMQSLYKKIKPVQCFCVICSSDFPRNEVKQHISNCHLSGSDLKCQNCDMSCRSKMALEQHFLSEHTSFYEVLCIYCDNSFNNKKLLRNHILTVHNKAFECPKCRKTFITARVFHEHCLSHEMTHAFNCAVCGDGFARKNLLNSHVREIHKPGGKYMCKLCRVFYPTYHKLLNHVLEIHGSVYKCKTCANYKAVKQKERKWMCLYKHVELPEYTCYVCQKKCPNIKEIFKHLLKEHANRNENKCLVCNAVKKNRRTLRDHMLLKYTDCQRMECVKCSKVFKGRSRVLNHFETHHNLTKFECTENGCGKKFQNLRKFKEHQFIHETSRQFKCAECPAEYSTKNSLTVHINSKHTENVSRFNCQICPAVFPSKCRLSRHEKKHGKPVICKCGAKFRSDLSDSYTKHVTLNCQKVKCNFCEKTFLNDAGLRSHSRNTHNKKNIIKCEICDKCFVSNQTLKSHMSLHTGERKSFICYICGKSYTAMGVLQRHLRIHTGQRDFKCSLCDASFTQRIMLIMHMKVHNDERNYMCEKCGYRFRTKYALTLHMKTVRFHSQKKSVGQS